RDPLRRNPKIRTSTNQCLFQSPNVINHTQCLATRALRRESAQIKNWISNQLPRPVKRHIPAAITFEYFNSASNEHFRRRNHVRRLSIAPERDYRRVLEQKKRIADATVFAQPDQFLLQTQACRVVDR